MNTGSLSQKVPTDLKYSARQASYRLIFRFYHRGHVHIAAACGIDDVDDLWLPFSRDLKRK